MERDEVEKQVFTFARNVVQAATCMWAWFAFDWKVAVLCLLSFMAINIGAGIKQ